MNGRGEPDLLNIRAESVKGNMELILHNLYRFAQRFSEN